MTLEVREIGKHRQSNILKELVVGTTYVDHLDRKTVETLAREH